MAYFSAHKGMAYLLGLTLAAIGFAELGNKPTAGDRMHGDGRLTGPGTVYFQLENISIRNESVHVVGAVFGDTGGGPVILKNTTPEILAPKKIQQISLVVSREEYRNWSEQYPVLKLGITYPPGFDATGWDFYSALRPEDFNVLKAGQFLVRGKFSR
jgi:hypothetical protein